MQLKSTVALYLHFSYWSLIPPIFESESWQVLSMYKSISDCYLSGTYVSIGVVVGGFSRNIIGSLLVSSGLYCLKGGRKPYNNAGERLWVKFPHYYYLPASFSSVGLYLLCCFLKTSIWVCTVQNIKGEVQMPPPPNTTSLFCVVCLLQPHRIDRRLTDMQIAVQFPPKRLRSTLLLTQHSICKSTQRQRVSHKVCIPIQCAKHTSAAPNTQGLIGLYQKPKPNRTHYFLFYRHTTLSC